MGTAITGGVFCANVAMIDCRPPFCMPKSLLNAAVYKLLLYVTILTEQYFNPPIIKQLLLLRAAKCKPH